MRHIHAPLTLPKHPKLLHEINQMSIRIKAWYLIDWSKHNEDERFQLQSHNPMPTWEEIEKLLMEAYQAINEQREDPRKY